MLTVAMCALTLGIAPPETKTDDVTDVYHGTPVVDAYRWLEDWADPEVKEWSERQNVHARGILDALPSVNAIRDRVTEIEKASSVSYGSLARRDNALFAIKRDPAVQQPQLVTLPSAYDLEGERIVLDPNAMDPSGSTHIDWFVPSPDGHLVAVSLSVGGTESGDVHIISVKTGEVVDHIVPRVNGGTAGGDLAWLPDGSGFLYTRYPRVGERSGDEMNFWQQVYLRKLGTPLSADTYELGEGLPRIALIQIESHLESGRYLATVQDGDGGEFRHFLRSPDGSWRQFSEFGDGNIEATFGPGSSIYLVQTTSTPRGQIVRLDGDTLDVAGAEVVIPEGEDTIVTDFYGGGVVRATPRRIYVVYQLGGPSEIRVFDHEGARLQGPEQLAISSVSKVVPSAPGRVLYWNASFIEAPAWYEFDARRSTTTKTTLATKAAVDFSDCEVVREFATSKDGTKVPVNIIRRKGTSLDGSNPTYLTGYGGYGINITPRFRASARVWLEQGGIYAVANIRGGGEYGEAWHRAGNLTNKQNVFDDFAGAMQHLIERGYTTPDRLAIVGGSNGGLLMGAMITQVPDRFAATVSYVGIYDMLRVELSPNGAFNIPEFGTVTRSDHFDALYAYSPYHNVQDGDEYPGVLFMTGANDPRVDPMQSRKMTARLQAANASGDPVLLRTSSNTGHGGGTPLNERIEQTTDMYAFLFAQLGVKYRPVSD